MIARSLLVVGLLGGLTAAVCAPPVSAAPAVHASPAVSAISVPRGLTVRLVDEPTALKADPRAAVYVIDQLRPGQQITRHVEVTNHTSAATTASLYPSAAAISGGGFAIATGRAVNDLTGWTTITPASLPLAVGASATATVTITVPMDATSGERYEGLVAALPVVRSTAGIGLENRVAIRTYLSVSSSRAPVRPPDFTIGSLQASRQPGGVPVVTATVTNTGGRALDLTGVLRLSDGPGGTAAGPYDTTGATTLGVGASGQVMVRLDPSLPTGPWLARIDMTSGLLTRAATATISFPVAGQTAAPVAARAVHARQRSILGWLVGALLGLTALGLLLVLLLRRRRRDGEEPPVTVAEPAPVLTRR